MNHEQTPLLRTPLYDCHQKAGARLVEFAGWEMPVYYGGINREVEAVRQRAGLFDVSHMGRLYFSGPSSEALLQRLTVNDVAALQDGAGQYSLMLKEDGGILDDLIVYRQQREDYLLIVNASNREKILSWIMKHGLGSCRLEDSTRTGALLALQGPDALRIAGELGLGEPPARFHVKSAALAGIPARISRTGYTGEDGVEIVLETAHFQRAPDLWNALLEKGAEPCGLGARDTLRLEAAYCLYSHEIDESTNPFEARLSWVVKLGKGDFIGKAALLEQRSPQRALVGVEMEERSVPRPGQAVISDNQEIGHVTSGTYSPTLGRSIAMAYVKPEYKQVGLRVGIAGGPKLRQGQVRSLPFYRQSPSNS